MKHLPDRNMRAGQVILHGDCWPVVSAVEILVKSIRPGYQCSTVPDLPSLIQRLTDAPGASLILCLRPREHIYLFYALRNTLYRHPVLVISDEMLFSDRVLLRILGQIPCMMHQSLLRVNAGRRLCEWSFTGRSCCPEDDMLTDFLLYPALPPGLPDTLPSFPLEAPLMNYLSLIIYRDMDNLGITPFRLRLLQAMYTGHQSYEELASLMNVSPRKIWNEKHRLITQLGMQGRLRDLLYGTRFCSFIQRTPFMESGEGERLRVGAGAGETPVHEDNHFVMTSGFSG